MTRIIHTDVAYINSSHTVSVDGRIHPTRALKLPEARIQDQFWLMQENKDLPPLSCYVKFDTKAVKLSLWTVNITKKWVKEKLLPKLMRDLRFLRR
jgi:hypothetical protein